MPSPEEEEEEDVAAEQEQGRTVAQSGQRITRRSRRQVAQIPVFLRLEGCLVHFQTSSSSMYNAIFVFQVELFLSLLFFVGESFFF